MSRILLVLFVALLLTGCALNGGDVYIVEYDFSAITDTEPQEISLTAADYTLFNFSWNHPGTSPSMLYAGLFARSATRTSYGVTYSAVGAPQHTTVYAYSNKPDTIINYETVIDYGPVAYCVVAAFAQKESAGLNGVQDLLVNGTDLAVSYGGPYRPLSLTIADNRLVPTSLAFLEGRHSFVSQQPTRSVCGEEDTIEIFSFEPPILHVYADNVLLLEEKLVDIYGGREGLWNASKIDVALGTDEQYTAVVTIPAYRPLYNLTVITATFNTALADSEPPVLVALDIPLTYTAEVPVPVFVHAADESSFETRVFVRSDGDWELALAAQGTIVNESLSLEGSQYDLLISLTDEYGNEQNYTIMPALMKQRAVVIDFEDAELQPATSVAMRPEVSSEGEPVRFIGVQALSRGNLFAQTNTNAGGLAIFETTLPHDISTADARFATMPVGVYAGSTYSFSHLVRRFEQDLAIEQIRAPPVIYPGMNNVTVVVSNAGTSSMSAELQVWTHTSEVQVPLTLAPGEIRSVTVPIDLYNSRGDIVVIQASLPEDDNGENNYAYLYEYVVTAYDAGIDLETEGVVFAGKPHDFIITINNFGYRDLTNTRYEATLTSENGTAVLLEEDVISIAAGQSVRKTIPVLFDSEGDYTLRAEVTAPDDQAPINDEATLDVYVNPAGADLVAEIVTPPAWVEGTSRNIGVVITNRGTQSSAPGTVTLVVGNRSETITLIEEEIGAIGPDENITLTASYVTYEAGWIFIEASVDVEDDLAPWNNQANSYPRILHDGVFVDLYAFHDQPVANSTIEFFVILDNGGSLPVDEAELSLVQDGETVYVTSVSVAPDESTLVPANITLGDEETRIEVVVRPAYEGTEYTFNTVVDILPLPFVSRTFTVTDFAQQPVHRSLGLWTSTTGTWMSFPPREQTIDLALLPHSLQLDASINRSRVLLEFSDVELSERTVIRSELYPLLHQDKVRYHYVTVNDLAVNGAGNVTYSLSARSQELQDAGLPGAGFEMNYSNYSLFSCAAFNTVAQSCTSGWTEEQPVVSFYSSYQGYQYLYVENSLLRAQAYAISLTELPDGNTTDLDAVEDDIVEDFVIEKTERGTIEFEQPVNVSRLRRDRMLMANLIDIRPRHIGIDAALSELLSTPALLTFHNVGLQRPTVLRNNQPCPPSICSGGSYDAAADMYTVRVTQFSDYDLVEDTSAPTTGKRKSKPKPLPYYLRKKAEPPKPIGTPRFGLGVNGSVQSVSAPAVCKPEWRCTWSVCDGQYKHSECVDVNKCGTTEGKPAQDKQSCAVQATVAAAAGAGTEPLVPVAPNVESPAPVEAFTAPLPWLWVAIAAGVLIVIVGATVVLERRLHNPARNPLAYAQTLLEEGKTRVAVRKELEAHFSDADIDDVFALLDGRAFVLDARKNGKSSDEIVGALEKTGWSEKDARALVEKTK